MIWVMRLTLVLLLAGCASTPIVDQAGVDQEAYEADLKECQYYADQVNSGQIIATSSALTGLFGGLLSMAVGDESSAKKSRWRRRHSWRRQRFGRIRGEKSKSCSAMFAK